MQNRIKEYREKKGISQEVRFNEVIIIGMLLMMFFLKLHGEEEKDGILIDEELG